MPRNQSAQNAERWRDQGLPLHTRPRYSNPAYDGPNAAAIAPVGQPRAITTYRRRGLQKPGIEIGAHAVIHMKDTDPEKMNIKYYDLAKQPLAVEPASMTEKLLPSSVVHVGKIHTVEFNQKVKEVGVLTGESRKRLRGYINDSLNLDALEHDKK
ncbi:uncharacterized protein CIMG_05288 [Coccidioides immitis RS]|uniref:DUF6590 domain-containing protein n=1 Tax=Coccidioides immitis (strain RS) TaxID=246410 RepID=J3KF87_COCIM|nr:uncharacterized protein CIMG_05288 [Coccidioides immitis RS]EAS34264.3 hypothetical protein CIMG_05288 [Coccidioides immitis RS]